MGSLSVSIDVEFRSIVGHLTHFLSIGTLLQHHLFRQKDLGCVILRPCRNNFLFILNPHKDKVNCVKIEFAPKLVPCFRFCVFAEISQPARLMVKFMPFSVTIFCGFWCYSSRRFKISKNLVSFRSSLVVFCSIYKKDFTFLLHGAINVGERCLWHDKSNCKIMRSVSEGSEMQKSPFKVIRFSLRCQQC